jgi:hypothetical protein
MTYVERSVGWREHGLQLALEEMLASHSLLSRVFDFEDVPTRGGAVPLASARLERDATPAFDLENQDTFLGVGDNEIGLSVLGPVIVV